ncbi:hypothetical protein DPMN_135274 [Dreissena polymorpha]|uniref:Uncharacterized protein n=1 Tax=Dreissena polymorpha TaxID=45954 RepID=A0A9D4JEI2_DREPO|nr:hypothetical protein DPMN_135274 [Dreissena polymorpha]
MYTYHSCIFGNQEISIYNNDSSVKVDLGINITLPPGGGLFYASEVNKLLDNALAEAKPSPSTEASQRVATGISMVVLFTNHVLCTPVLKTSVSFCVS